MIISDCGGEFNSTLDHLLAEQLGIQRRLTTPRYKAALSTVTIISLVC